ncbi:collagen alpha-6(VI) chain-like [Ixodes scapularis]|uniref:collagen alpha-6(VI) chain-like n=1 Tax=Ixodes scapularis TaxID=6945 RepID=UPI001A9D0B49|nr:collagen alpha-6(VI) chain-like [Ixodes scapularis]
MRSAGLVAVLLLSLASSPTTCREIDPELRTFVSTLERYSTTKNDVIFLLESGNIEADHFSDALFFTETLARLFIVSPEYSRLTVMTSSDQNLVHIDQVRNIDDANMCTFAHDVKWIQHRSGNTKTREALEHATTILRDARHGVNKIIILISGALSNGGSETYTAALSLKDDGVIIFCVGVADVNQQKLSTLATTTSHAYFFSSFEYIRSASRSLQRGKPVLIIPNLNNHKTRHSVYIWYVITGIVETRF